jgi:hypothetical protein
LRTSSRKGGLLPRHQTAYPARDLLAESTLHRRRETTFLVLATMAFVATTALVTSGTGVTYDITSWIESVLPDLSFPVALRVGLGAVPGVLGVLAIASTCDLYGAGRAAGLVAACTAACGALGGLMIVAADGDDAIGIALSLMACAIVGQLVFLAVFALLRRAWSGRHAATRTMAAAVIAQPAAWAAYGAATIAFDRSADVDAVAAICGGSAAFVVACTLVLAIPLAMTTRGLALFLRVARSGNDIDVITDEADYRGGPRNSSSTLDHRFFSDGDQVGNEYH